MAQAVEAGTRMIFPAPAEMHAETGVLWFEAHLSPSDPVLRLVGFAKDHRQVGTLETRLGEVGDLKTVISEGDARVTIELRGREEDSGQVKFAGRINGRDFTIDGPGGDADSVQSSTLELGAADERLLRRWRGLSDSLKAVIEATRDPSADSAEWGCIGCSLLGATIVQAADLCLHDSPGACSVLLHDWVLFQDNCEPPPCH